LHCKALTKEDLSTYCALYSGGRNWSGFMVSDTTTACHTQKLPEAVEVLEF
jgi:hypothetical protein